MATTCPKCHADNPDTKQFCGDCGTQLGPPKDIGVTKTIETPVEEYPRGRTFADRYNIIEKLGKGGMGAVYRVEDTNIGQDIALKLIKPDIAYDKKTIERFRNELKTTRMISHKNVCRMFDLAETEGTYYITMEYVPGEDLKSLIKRVDRLDSATAIKIAKQVCEGLSEAHRLGVVHRDLKSSNIMIDKEGNARIMDFGIARSLSTKGLTGEGIIIGTPEYMSPEQTEAKEVDHRSDIYSLGVILYEMVTGMLPFEGGTPLSIAMKHKGEKPKDPKALNPQIQADLNTLILKCLEKDKEKRYQSADEVRSELTSIEKGIPTTEREIPKRKPLTSKEITVTFGLKKLFIPALIVIAIAIVGVIISQLLPRKEVKLAPKVENSIAVISFKNQTGDKTFDYLQEAIPNLLITNLENTGLLYVVTWERMHDLLGQLGKKDVEIIDRDLGFEICRMEGVESIVLGSFVKAGNVFATDVKVLDVETKRLMKSANIKGEGIESILRTQIDELSKQIYLGVGVSEKEIQVSQVGIADVTTDSMEAYRYFLTGRENARKYYFSEARSFLEKAVELDPQFSMAYLILANVYRVLQESKARDDAYEKAMTFSQRATEKERLLIEAAYANRIEKDQEKRFLILEQMAKKYPREKDVHNELAYYFKNKQLFHEAIEEYSKVLELDPNSGNALNSLGEMYGYLREYERAIEYYKKYLSLYPGEANPLDSVGWCYFLLGRFDEALAKFKEALEIKPDFYYSLLSVIYVYALKENYPEAMKWIDRFIEMAPTSGRKAEGFLWKGFFNYFLGSLDQSLSDLRKASEIAESEGNADLIASTERMIGLVYCEKGRFKLSRQHLKSWFDVRIENYPQSLPRITAFYSFYLGLVDLEERQFNSAKSRLAEIESILLEKDPGYRDWITFYHDLLNGEILLAEKEVRKAIVVCEKASHLGVPLIQGILPYNIPLIKDVLARAYLNNAEIEKAIAEYEGLITFDPTRQDRCLIHPKYHFRLAKLYEKKGWAGKAIEHYEKFLNLWKDADPGQPEVEDAKKMLAGLRDA